MCTGEDVRGAEGSENRNQIHVSFVSFYRLSVGKSQPNQSTDKISTAEICLVFVNEILRGFQTKKSRHASVVLDI